ncbi:ABC transporter ATP-binding protein [Dysgonomonas sp. 520]|uniref:ABC transporter ATP-binding protein n=1 Tax=Dysgonomonas sp. 520 TaxID=2302931 RepID=UPI0013D0713A|nr:ABC transporter ATP-binding protein [Dysgonomonas sp. 520]NDW10920.1 ABC transporter ATP-binding protein [Dysgonomonas sp. 520]
MKRYWQILKKYKYSLALSPFLILVSALSETTQPYLMSQIIDDGIMANSIGAVYSIGIKMVIVSIIGLVASFINIRVSSKTAVGFGTDLRTALFDKIQQLSFSDIDRFSTSSLITRLTNDNSKIQQLILMSMRLLLRAPMMLVMATFFAVSINTGLASVLMISIPILGLCVYAILSKGFPFFVKIQQKIDNLNSVVRENLINIRVIKSFVREDFEVEKFRETSEDLRDTVIKASNIIVTIFPAMQLILNLSILAILWFGGQKVISGNMKVGELVSFVNYLTQILMSLMMLSMVIMSFARAAASSKRITEVLDAEPSLSNTKEGLENKHQIEGGDVTFRNVCFRYSGGETDVLKDIDFVVKRGETIAIAGATGSAKSSLLQLIPRLYDVTSGEILIDGINVKDYNLDELHAKIGMVLQNNDLFTGTIEENLRWGKPDATRHEIEEAAKAAQAHDFITSFTDGYQTLLGRGGVNVSGGQKQRICIARALLRKPKVLILDDSTSAVDTDTEQKIRTNLNRLLNSTTVFIVTQRVNTMQSADRVLVLDDGEIAALGTPSELLENSEAYKEIYNSQQLVM